MPSRSSKILAMPSIGATMRRADGAELVLHTSAKFEPGTLVRMSDGSFVVIGRRLDSLSMIARPSRWYEHWKPKFLAFVEKVFAGDQ
jgi:hypothetical protein